MKEKRGLILAYEASGARAAYTSTLAPTYPILGQPSLVLPPQSLLVSEREGERNISLDFFRLSRNY